MTKPQFRCTACDYETDVVYDAACHAYALGGDHHTVGVVPGEGEYEAPEPPPVYPDALEPRPLTLVAASTMTADFLDSYSDESELAQTHPILVDLMRLYAAQLREAVAHA